VVGNVTEVTQTGGCQRSMTIAVAVRDRPVAVYRMVDLRRRGGSFDPAVLRARGWQSSSSNFATGRPISTSQRRDFFAATTQAPTPPGAEIMNPDWTEWLWRVDPQGLTALPWPGN
jgi:hypothetical protein